MNLIKNYKKTLSKAIESINSKDIMNVAMAIENCKGYIFIFGNGGSAATASHFSQDLNRLNQGKCICLNDNTPSILSYANDLDFEAIFVLQLSNLLTPTKDLVIGISCSGNSPNIIRAIEYAKNNGALTVGFTGFDGGQLKRSVNFSLHVPCYDMQICEDIHLTLTHLIGRLLLKPNQLN